MAHPLIILNQPIWLETLDHFNSALTANLLKDGCQPDEVRSCLKQYHDLMTAHQQGIFEKTAFDISQYTSDYRVQVREGIADEFKAIYFLGMNIAKCLIENQKLKKQHYGAVLDLLDYRLAEPHKANRPKLTARILSMIDKDHIVQNLGKHGWYLLYKCLFNAAQDHQTGSKELL